VIDSCAVRNNRGAEFATPGGDRGAVTLQNGSSLLCVDEIFYSYAMEESSMNLDARPVRDPFANDRLKTLQRAKQEPM
jgi:hypothetical protein